MRMAIRIVRYIAKLNRDFHMIKTECLTKGRRPNLSMQLNSKMRMDGMEVRMGVQVDSLKEMLEKRECRLPRKDQSVTFARWRDTSHTSVKVNPMVLPNIL